MKHRFLLNIFLAACLCGAAFAAENPERVYNVQYSGAAISDTTAVVLIDLSDTTAFPHTATTRADIHGIVLSASATGSYTVNAGPVTSCSSAAGTTEVALKWNVQNGAVNVSQDFTYPIKGNSAKIGSATGDSLVYKDYLGSTFGFMSSATGTVGHLLDSTGQPKTAGTGDWILWVDEKSEGQLDLSLGVTYSTN